MKQTNELSKIHINRFGRKETKLDQTYNAFHSAYWRFLNAKPWTREQKEAEEQCKILDTAVKKLKANWEKSVIWLALEKMRKKIRTNVTNLTNS